MGFILAYLVYVDQNDLVWSSQIHFVLRVHQVGDAFDDIVSFERVVIANRSSNGVLRIVSSVCSKRQVCEWMKTAQAYCGG